MLNRTRNTSEKQSSLFIEPHFTSSSLSYHVAVQPWVRDVWVTCLIIKGEGVMVVHVLGYNGWGEGKVFFIIANTGMKKMM